MGKFRFDGEDLFVDAEAGKVMTSWRLSLEADGESTAIRGLDCLAFKGDKLVRKHAYWKSNAPYFE